MENEEIRHGRICTQGWSGTAHQTDINAFPFIAMMFGKDHNLLKTIRLRCLRFVFPDAAEVYLKECHDCCVHAVRFLETKVL